MSFQGFFGSRGSSKAESCSNKSHLAKLRQRRREVRFGWLEGDIFCVLAAEICTEFVQYGNFGGFCLPFKE